MYDIILIFCYGEHVHVMKTVSEVTILLLLSHLPAVMGFSKWGAVLVVGVVCIFYSALVSIRL